MTLIQIANATSVLLIIVGALYIWSGKVVVTLSKSFPRSKPATYLLMGIATGWVLWNISNLGIADFGDYKEYIFIFFATIGVLSFYFVPDFLAVRGACILVLLAARLILDIGWMQYEPHAQILKVFVYTSIIAALYLGAAPYKLRDFFDWLFESSGKSKTFGALIAGYGLLLALASVNS
jgi:hypothetical protein